VTTQNPINLNAPTADRQRESRIEHDQWVKDHPHFSSKELLENWTRIRQKWGLTHNATSRKAA